MIKIMLEYMSPEFKVRMCWTLVWLKLIEKKNILTLYLPWVTSIELLITISIQYQVDKWWE